jgi:hypothetical protein
MKRDRQVRKWCPKAVPEGTYRVTEWLVDERGQAEEADEVVLARARFTT